MLGLFSIHEGLRHETECPENELGNFLKVADWIDVQEPNEGERGLLQRMLHTNLPESDEVEKVEASTRCFVDQAGVHAGAETATRLPCSNRLDGNGGIRDLLVFQAQGMAVTL